MKGKITPEECLAFDQIVTGIVGTLTSAEKKATNVL